MKLQENLRKFPSAFDIYNGSNISVRVFVIVDDSRWQTIVRSSNGPLTEYSVSYQNLLPSTSYLFRVISYNRYGISYPAYSTETVNNTVLRILIH